MAIQHEPLMYSQSTDGSVFSRKSKKKQNYYQESNVFTKFGRDTLEPTEDGRGEGRRNVSGRRYRGYFFF